MIPSHSTVLLAIQGSRKQFSQGLLVSFIYSQQTSFHYVSYVLLSHWIQFTKFPAERLFSEKFVISLKEKCRFIHHFITIFHIKATMYVYVFSLIFITIFSNEIRDSCLLNDTDFIVKMCTINCLNKSATENRRKVLTDSRDVVYLMEWVRSTWLDRTDFSWNLAIGFCYRFSGVCIDLSKNLSK